MTSCTHIDFFTILNIEHDKICESLVNRQDQKWILDTRLCGNRPGWEILVYTDCSNFDTCLKIKIPDADGFQNFTIGLFQLECIINSYRSGGICYFCNAHRFTDVADFCKTELCAQTTYNMYHQIMFCGTCKVYKTPCKQMMFQHMRTVHQIEPYACMYCKTGLFHRRVLRRRHEIRCSKNLTCFECGCELCARSCR